MGKIIYCPKAKAGEYAKYAANFFCGCSGKCNYCYNRKGITAKVLGGDNPILKKTLKTEMNALSIFCKELGENLESIQEHGLFFNFVSDPCLSGTINLNFKAVTFALSVDVPVKILTKQSWWIDESGLNPYEAFVEPLIPYNNLISFGFTLTGHDELELGCSTNQDRIYAMSKLHNAGFKTWASIEPIIDFNSSLNMIVETIGFCDLYKIGLQSGVKYNKNDLFNFIDQVQILIQGKYPIYFKDSLLKQAEIDREDLPFNCVTKDFKL